MLVLIEAVICFILRLRHRAAFCKAICVTPVRLETGRYKPFLSQTENHVNLDCGLYNDLRGINLEHALYAVSNSSFEFIIEQNNLFYYHIVIEIVPNPVITFYKACITCVNNDDVFLYLSMVYVFYESTATQLCTIYTGFCTQTCFM